MSSPLNRKAAPPVNQVPGSASVSLFIREVLDIYFLAIHIGNYDVRDFNLIKRMTLIISLFNATGCDG
jgi:hypothetical protein